MKMKDSSFDGKVVLVTGAAGGIGRAAAVAFGRAGACVVVADTSVDEPRASPRPETADRVVERQLLDIDPHAETQHTIGDFLQTIRSPALQDLLPVKRIAARSWGEAFAKPGI